MACKNNAKLCNRLVVSTAVAYTAPNLVITIPAGSYQNCEKYCIVVAQNIPAATTLDAPVVIQIAGGTQLYPVTTCNCAPLTARSIRSRWKYAMRVRTTPTSGVFRLLSSPCECCNVSNNLLAINGTAPAAPTEPAE